MDGSGWLTLVLVFQQMVSVQPGQTHVARTTHEIDFDRVEWTAMSGATSPVYYSMLQIDETSGATQMLWRFPANSTSPCHWHAANESNVVVKGSVTMRHMGTAGKTLGVGGFSYVAKHVNHQLTTGPTETVVFSSLDGRFDFNPVDTSQCAAPAQQASPGRSE